MTRQEHLVLENVGGGRATIVARMLWRCNYTKIDMPATVIASARHACSCSCARVTRVQLRPNRHAMQCSCMQADKCVVVRKPRRRMFARRTKHTFLGTCQKKSNSYEKRDVKRALNTHKKSANSLMV